MQTECFFAEAQQFSKGQQERLKQASSSRPRNNMQMLSRRRRSQDWGIIVRNHRHRCQQSFNCTIFRVFGIIQTTRQPFTNIRQGPLLREVRRWGVKGPNPQPPQVWFARRMAASTCTLHGWLAIRRDNSTADAGQDNRPPGAERTALETYHQGLAVVTNLEQTDLVRRVDLLKDDRRSRALPSAIVHETCTRSQARATYASTCCISSTPPSRSPTCG